MAVEKAPNVPCFVTYCATLIPTVFDNSLSYYEALCALAKWMQDNLVNVVNNNAAVTEQYIKLTEELQSYVENYFENLDVQDEIDHKLDEMAAAGTLQEIIASYLEANVAWTFDTVADMKLATNLVDGSYAMTLGFHAIGDGGGALYKITDTGTANEMDVIAVDALYATLVPTEANPLQFGAYGDGTQDDTLEIQAAADYALSHSLSFHMPPKSFLCDTVTIENLRTVNIEGQIKLSANTQTLNVYGDTLGVRPNIYINQVTVGDIVMKGLNSATVQIEDAERLRLIADNTAGHDFIGYTTFNLGFIRYLVIEDDGSGTKWINENLFIGGRYLGVTIGGGTSTYPHENNLFLEPMCEHTTWNFNYCSGNRVVKARLEGTVTVNFAADAVANTIEQDYGGTLQGYYNPSHLIPSNITVNDLSGGQNYVITNKNLLVDKKIITVNKFNNPNSVTVSGEYLQPGRSATLWDSEIIELPDKVFALWFEMDNPHLDIRISCYDENKQLTSSLPSTSLLKNSPTLAGLDGHTYGNGSYSRYMYWAIIAPNNPTIKYIKLTLATPDSAGADTARFRNVNVTLTAYDELSPYVVEGLSTNAS